MKAYVLFFSLLTTLASCNNTHKNQGPNTKDTSAATIGQKNTPITNLTGCYLRTQQRDTLALRLEHDGKDVKGRLTFDNFEKDGSTGSVKGTVTGDILKLIYDFQSEGMQSVMDVYFKVADGGLIHGIGEVNVKTDTTYFADTTQINYPEANKLLKVPCESLPFKYK